MLSKRNWGSVITALFSLVTTKRHCLVFFQEIAIFSANKTEGYKPHYPVLSPTCGSWFDGFALVSRLSAL